MNLLNQLQTIKQLEGKNLTQDEIETVLEIVTDAWNELIRLVPVCGLGVVRRAIKELINERIN
jgi:hypothetical protein